jgi:hypothetical protein
MAGSVSAENVINALNQIVIIGDDCVAGIMTSAVAGAVQKAKLKLTK